MWGQRGLDMELERADIVSGLWAGYGEVKHYNTSGVEHKISRSYFLGCEYKLEWSYWGITEILQI